MNGQLVGLENILRSPVGVPDRLPGNGAAAPGELPTSRVLAVKGLSRRKKAFTFSLVL